MDMANRPPEQLIKCACNLYTIVFVFPHRRRAIMSPVWNLNEIYQVSGGVVELHFCFFIILSFFFLFSLV